MPPQPNPARPCRICKRNFRPTKYNHTQETCSRKTCQKARHKINQDAWYKEHPGYSNEYNRKIRAGA